MMARTFQAGDFYLGLSGGLLLDYHSWQMAEMVSCQTAYKNWVIQRAL